MTSEAVLIVSSSPFHLLFAIMDPLQILRKVQKSPEKIVHLGGSTTAEGTRLLLINSTNETVDESCFAARRTLPKINLGKAFNYAHETHQTSKLYTHNFSFDFSYFFTYFCITSLPASREAEFFDSKNIHSPEN